MRLCVRRLSSAFGSVVDRGCALGRGKSLSGLLKVVAIGEERETWNVAAETKKGHPNNVIVVRIRLILALTLLPPELRLLYFLTCIS